MQMDNDKRWDAIYGNVITEGRRIKRKRNIIKFVSATSFVFILGLFLYTGNLSNGSEILMERFPEDFTYNEDYVEIALIAQGVFFDDELGLLME
jgi:hypothetical protein